MCIVGENQNCNSSPFRAGQVLMTHHKGSVTVGGTELCHEIEITNVRYSANSEAHTMGTRLKPFRRQPEFVT
jgi:hypothetical protein